MSTLPTKLVKEGHPALSQKCEEVDVNDKRAKEQIRNIVRDMQAVLVAHNNGCGLAANQIGVNKRIIVISHGSFRATIINPEVNREWGGKRSETEGCLSFPGKQAKVLRAKHIQVVGFNEELEPVKYTLKDFRARIALHEIDHLDGINMLDREAELNEKIQSDLAKNKNKAA